jgi:hypothetical protein
MTYTMKVTAYPGTKAHDEIEVQVEVEVEVEIEVKVGRSSAGSTFFSARLYTSHHAKDKMS